MGWHEMVCCMVWCMVYGKVFMYVFLMHTLWLHLEPVKVGKVPR